MIQLFDKSHHLYLPPPYLHDEPSVDEPRSLSDAEVGAAELHQAVVVQNLKVEREGEISRQSPLPFPFLPVAKVVNWESRGCDNGRDT